MAKAKKTKVRAKPSKKVAPGRPSKTKRAARHAARPAKKRAATSAKKRVAKPAKKRAVKAKSVRRRDRPGHMDSSYAKELLARRDSSADDPGEGFVKGKRSDDALAEQLAESFVETATTGEDEGEELLDRQVDEESGGPFVESPGSREFAHGTDESNPRGAEREPFPKT